MAHRKCICKALRKGIHKVGSYIYTRNKYDAPLETGVDSYKRLKSEYKAFIATEKSPYNVIRNGLFTLFSLEERGEMKVKRRLEKRRIRGLGTD